MNEMKNKLVQSWFLKANNDLRTAKKIATPPDPILDTAIFHCQQCAEKAIKGFLVHHDIELQRTHNLRILIMMAIEISPGYEQWLKAAELLTAYSTTFRYPGNLDLLTPSADEFHQALNDAEGIYRYSLSLLPEEVISLVVSDTHT